MNNVFIDVDYSQIFKHGQRIGGDVFLLSRSPESNQIVATLSDGLGSGVKANVLASLTAHMAHRMSFSPIEIRHSAEIIMNTLPVCKERKISYSTFTIAKIHYLENLSDIKVDLIEYDNPAALRFNGSVPVKWEKTKTELQRAAAFKKEIITSSSFKLETGDRLVMFSDGVTQAGLGQTLSLGWRLSGVKAFLTETLERNPDISSRDLSRSVVQQAATLDGLSAKDDITCVVLYVRKPRRTMVVTGPPFTKEADQILKERLESFEGKKIVSGGTTAQIVSRLFGRKLTVDLKCWSKDVPPSSRMEGIDLVTEGMLTLSRVATLLEEKTPLGELPDDPAKRFVELLLNSDQVHFLVGTKINEAHQSPDIPVEIGIRRTMIGRLRRVLEDIYLKETTVEYL